ESRNVALGVDLPIIAAVGGLLVGDVNPLEIEGVSGFASHDVRGHGAGAGGVVELHVQFLSGAVDWANGRPRGKDPAFVPYDQFLSTGILQPLSRGEVRCGSDSVIRRCRLNVRFARRQTWMKGAQHLVLGRTLTPRERTRPGLLEYCSVPGRMIPGIT